jgi:hypothetical protein
MPLTDEALARALNIEQSKELSAYRIARENENDTVSQHSRSFPDNGESTGRGSHMNSQAGDGLAIADVSPQDDRYTAVQICFLLTNVSPFFQAASTLTVLATNEAAL